LSFLVRDIGAVMLDDRRPKPVSCGAGCLWPAALLGFRLDWPAARWKA